jgi:large repetitive protein
VEGDSLTYTVVQGPTKGTLTGTPPAVTYRPNANFNGSDSFTFRVSDGQVATATATVSLTVVPVNDVPTALGQERTVGQRPTLFTLAAHDADGDALEFRIQQGPERGTIEASLPGLRHTPPPDFRGTVQVVFTASDRQATSAPAALVIHVQNEAPKLSVSVSVPNPHVGETVLFGATAEDPGGDTLTWSWDLGDGSTSAERHPSHAYSRPGTYQVRATVSDGVASVQESLVLEVRNVAPRLESFEVPPTAEEGQRVSFRALAAASHASELFAYAWDFGDGTAPVQGNLVSHSYAEDGTCLVTVTVWDDSGASTLDTRQIQVSNLSPTASSVQDQKVLAGEELHLLLQAQDPAGASDPLTWTLVAGPGTLTPRGDYTWRSPAEGRGAAAGSRPRAR